MSSGIGRWCRLVLVVGALAPLVLASCGSDSAAPVASDTAPSSASAPSSAAPTSTVPRTTTPRTSTPDTTTASTTTPGTTVPATTTTAAPTTAAPTTAAPTTAVPTTAAPPTTVVTTTTAAPVVPAVEIWRGDPDRRAVALTFDAGSDCGNAGTILTILADEGITATFGLTGEWVEACPTEAARIGRAGHQILNHSYDHPSFTGLSTGEEHLTDAEIIDQLSRAEVAIVQRTGRGTRPWARVPYGDRDAAVHLAMGMAGFRYDVLWTIDSRGWLGTDPATVVDIVVDGAVNGAIVVMHVGSLSTDYLALPTVIDRLREAGYEFDTVAGVV